MRRLPMLFSIVALIPLTTPVALAEDTKPDADKPAGVMKEKLKNSQLILEGVTMNDFAKVTEGSKELLAASKKAGWMVVQTPEYQLHSETFRRACAELISAAEKKSVERAALAYVDMTLTCVKCHQHVREQGIGLRLESEKEWRKTHLTALSE